MYEWAVAPGQMKQVTGGTKPFGLPARKEQPLRLHFVLPDTILERGYFEKWPV